MAVAKVKTGHFYTRIVPAIWVVVVVAIMLFLPGVVAIICTIFIFSFTGQELLRMRDAANKNRNAKKQPLWPWAIEWLLLLLLPFSILTIYYPNNKVALAWLIGVVFVSDVGAYYGGKLLSKYTGGHKLAERISPGKTWEGVGTGLLGATLWCTLMLPFGLDIHTGLLYCMAWLLAIIGMAGDLLESWLKRQAGVKDSGTLLRDHGGMLDRLDGLLAAAPVAAVIFWQLLPN